MTVKKKSITSSGTSDEAVKKATGKIWNEWFKILDKADSTDKSHKEIAQWINDNFTIGSWWSQMLTVEYEKERGLRELYQKADGYEVSISKTIDISVSKLYEVLTNEKQRNKWLQQKINISKAIKNKSLRALWSDGKTRISIYFTSKGNNKSQITVQHMKLENQRQAREKKEFWTNELGKLEGIL